MVFGFDIGLTGSVAVFTNTGQFVEVFDLPVRPTMHPKVKRVIAPSELMAALQCRKKLDVMPICYAEELLAVNMGQQTGKFAYFSMGSSYGRVMSVLELMGWPCVEYRPSDWKRHFGLTKKRGEQKGKDASRKLALELYPEAERFLSRKKDHNRAESVLIARFGMDRSKEL